MSGTITSLRRKIESAGSLQSVVGAMKALAASSIGQYEQSVKALADYYRTVELGLGVCFRQTVAVESPSPASKGVVGAVVFGSDQGLVGRFNEVVVNHAVEVLGKLEPKPRVRAVGERVHGRLADAGIEPVGLFPVPNSVQGVAPLVGKILLECEQDRSRGGISELHLIHNRPASGGTHEPVHQRLLPLDGAWQSELSALAWPTKNLPEVIGGGIDTLRALIGEYLFVSLFKACAESLASENASRLAAMQRAERNINELLEDLNRSYRRLRQSGIDEELFDLIAGFEALSRVSDGPHGDQGRSARNAE